MIQPINSYDSRFAFKKANDGSGKSKFKRLSASDKALIGASGLSLVSGGVVTALSKNVTDSLLHAGVIGFFAATLTLFFMTPEIIKQSKNDTFVRTGGNPPSKKESSRLSYVLKEHFKPNKKMIQFKQANS